MRPTVYSYGKSNCYRFFQIYSRIGAGHICGIPALHRLVGHKLLKIAVPRGSPTTAAALHWVVGAPQRRESWVRWPGAVLQRTKRSKSAARRMPWGSAPCPVRRAARQSSGPGNRAITKTRAQQRPGESYMGGERESGRILVMATAEASGASLPISPSTKTPVKGLTVWRKPEHGMKS